MTLKTILKNKPPGIVSVPSEMRISVVTAVLAEKCIGAVLVMDGQNKLVGILSERDIVRSLASHAARTLDFTAAQLMTKNPVSADPATTVAKAMEIMTDGRFRHLPVMEDGKLVGLVSIGDVVKAKIDQSEYEVESLERYLDQRGSI